MINTIGDFPSVTSEVKESNIQWSQKLFLAWRTKCLAGLQRSVGHFEPLLDIFPVGHWQISVVSLVFLVRHFMGIGPCWTKCPPRSELSVGHVEHFSQSLNIDKWHLVFSYWMWPHVTLLFDFQMQISKVNLILAYFWRPCTYHKSICMSLNVKRHGKGDTNYYIMAQSHCHSKLRSMTIRERFQ